MEYKNLNNDLHQYYNIESSLSTQGLFFKIQVAQTWGRALKLTYRSRVDVCSQTLLAFPTLPSLCGKHILYKITSYWILLTRSYRRSLSTASDAQEKLHVQFLTTFLDPCGPQRKEVGTWLVSDIALIYNYKPEQYTC